ncbi:MAG: NAD/NADP octopine/nopaline dehydrogenase family protein [Hyphomicrobiaceae bacterium]|nr:NAD/NADP octopine/nopaline dehydrogenase family protein [Hyphomicrobiaceae bacterium]
MRIAVLGGGHGCYAAAADFSEAGHEVRMWRRDAAALAPLKEAGGITLKDHRGRRQVAVALFTEHMAEAVTGAELIFSPLPAFAQADVARAMAPHLGDGQVIFIPPGTFGSYVMSKALREAGCPARVAIAETGTLPWLTRKHGPAEVAITTRASRLPTGVLPARDTERALAVIGRAFPGVIEPVEDALSAALMNAGPIIHPPLIIMNAGPIAHFPRWDLHKEGTQPTIRRVHDALDAERMAVREALGYGPPHFPLADHYTTSNWMYGNLAHDKLVDSGDWHEKLDLDRHRYMAEDVEMGLNLLASVCRWAGVACPTADGLLRLGEVAAGRDFSRTGRTLEGLGLASLTRAEMAQLLAEGV